MVLWPHVPPQNQREDLRIQDSDTLCHAATAKQIGAHPVGQH